MAGNARRGPHCIGILFLCQEWRQWGLFFVGWSFVMKPMLPPIRQNVFLAAGRSPFLELLTLQKGPIVPFSATTPLFGRILRIVRRRATRARRLPPVPRRVRVPTACPLLFASGLSALSLVVCDPPPPPMIACFSWRSLLCACVTPPPFLCGRLLFLLPPHAESLLRPLRR